MPRITFNKIYLALIIVAVISAVIVPKRVTDRSRAQAQRFFAPVSYPVRVVAGGIYRRFNPAPLDVERPTGAPRTYQQIVDENQDLRLQIARMTEQLRRLQELNADREALGTLRELCRPMTVVGSDTSMRKALNLQGDAQGLKVGMAVLYRDGLAGKIDRLPWSGGAQALLVTDRGFRILAKFGRLEGKGEAMRFRILSEKKVLLEGNGSTGLVSRNVTEQDVREIGVDAGDWALIADEEYGPEAQGYRIGRVESVRPGKVAKFMEISVATQRDPAKLQEVMVLSK